MTPLRQRMLNDMTVRGLAENTKKSYLNSVTGLARHYRRSPDSVSAQQFAADERQRHDRQSAAGGAGGGDADRPRQVAEVLEEPRPVGPLRDAPVLLLGEARGDEVLRRARLVDGGDGAEAPRVRPPSACARSSVPPCSRRGRVAGPQPGSGGPASVRFPAGRVELVMNSCEIHELPPENGRDCHTVLPIIASTIVCARGSPRRPGRPRGGVRPRRRTESCARGERSSSSQGIGRPKWIVSRSPAPSLGATNCGPGARTPRRRHCPPRARPTDARSGPRSRLAPPCGTRAVAPCPSPAGPPSGGGRAGASQCAGHGVGLRQRAIDPDPGRGGVGASNRHDQRHGGLRGPWRVAGEKRGSRPVRTGPALRRDAHRYRLHGRGRAVGRRRRHQPDPAHP